MIDSTFIVVFSITILIWFVSSYTTLHIWLVDGLREDQLKRLVILIKVNIITTFILIAGFLWLLYELY